MAPGAKVQHLKQCRELYNQLREIHVRRQHEPRKAEPAAFDLSILLAHFDSYLKWLDRNSKVISLDERRPHSWTGIDGDSA